MGKQGRPGALVASVRHLPVSNRGRLRPDDRTARDLAGVLDDGGRRRSDRDASRQPPRRSPATALGDPAPRSHARRPRRRLHRAADPAMGRRGHGRARRARRRASRPRRRSQRPARRAAAVQTQPAHVDRLPRSQALEPVLRPERFAYPVPGPPGDRLAVRRVHQERATKRPRDRGTRGLQIRRTRRPRLPVARVRQPAGVAGRDDRCAAAQRQ